VSQIGIALCLSGCLAIACTTPSAQRGVSHWTQKVGEEVTIEGAVAKAIWQHMIRGVSGKQEVYVDLPDQTQTVAYIDMAFNCKGRIRLTGKVIELRGGSKRGSKIDDKAYVEYHLDVTRWECLD